jgi:hypothetical protein
MPYLCVKQGLDGKSKTCVPSFFFEAYLPSVVSTRTHGKLPQALLRLLEMTSRTLPTILSLWTHSLIARDDGYHTTTVTKYSRPPCPAYSYKMLLHSSRSYTPGQCDQTARRSNFTGRLGKANKRYDGIEGVIKRGPWTRLPGPPVVLAFLHLQPS